MSDDFDLMATFASEPPSLPSPQYADSGSDDGGSGSDSEEESAGRKRKTRRVQVVKGRKRIRRTPSTASAAAHDWRAAAHAAPAHVVSLTEDNAVTVDDDDDDDLLMPRGHVPVYASSNPQVRDALEAARKALTATATLRRQLYQSRNMQESLLSGIEQQQAALSAAPTGAGDDAATAATVSAILSSVSALQDADAHHEGGAESPQEDADATLMLKLRVAGSDTTSVVRMGMTRAFGVLREKLAASHGVPASAVRIIVDGDNVGDDETPQDLGLENEDLLDVKLQKQ